MGRRRLGAAVMLAVVLGAPALASADPGEPDEDPPDYPLPQGPIPPAPPVPEAVIKPPEATAPKPLTPVRPTGVRERITRDPHATLWAHVERRAAIRRQPRLRSRRVATLRFLTEDGAPEVYLVTHRVRDASGRSWLRVKVPGRPNGRAGWVRPQALGILYRVRTRLVIDRRRLRATLFRRGRRIWSARVGIGARGTPTPRGDFWIRERLKGFGGIYGPWAFGTSAYSRLSDWPGGGVVGIHGTNQPRLIPGRPSHGCIRVRNHQIRTLVKLMPVGTPVRIR